LARSVIPLFEDVSFIVGIQVMHRVDVGMLPAGDPEDQRPAVVVVAVPGTATGTVPVAIGSGTGRCGIRHPRWETPGLSKAGWFSRRANILCGLWTAGSVRSAGTVDDQTFAAMAAWFL